MAQRLINAPNDSVYYGVIKETKGQNGHGIYGTFKGHIGQIMDMKKKLQKLEDKKTFNKLLNRIRPLAAQIVKLKSDMKKMGMHTGDYDLIECPKCHLAEDVLVGNSLVTFFNIDVEDFEKVKYTKLKFMELKDSLFLCPNCGNIIKAKEF